MQKTLLTISMIMLFFISLVSAHEHDFVETKQLIDSGIDCDKLTDGQLESIGEYYMEQMHPGEQHEMMDQIMGGEESENLKQMHVAMGKNFYCGEDRMMGIMPIRGMMGGRNMMNSGGMTDMMGGWGYGFGYWSVFSILYLILLVGLIILVYLWIVRLWKNVNKKNRK